MSLILSSMKGREAGLTNGRLLAARGFTSGLDLSSRITLPAPTVVSLFDDFLGDSIGAEWGNPTKGSDAGTADFTLNAQVNGVIRGTTGAGAGGTMAVNGIQVHRALNWRASQDELAFEGRLKLSAITNISVFIGLTDQVSALEAPINSAGSANTITTTATDAVGFMFDTSMTTVQWWCVGVANDVDAVAVASGITPVAAAYDTLRVEVDTSGNARFWIDGIAVATMASAVTPGILLTPTVTAFTRTAASATVDVDYLHVSAKRV